MDDAALVEAARSGDPTAWGAIYDRYADKLHDHCHRILRDRDEAADALHDAFIAGARNLDQLRDPTRLRPWLYSICRHTSLRRLKAQQRVDLTDEMDDVSAGDGDLGRGVRSEELSELVWAAAAGLNGRDQALLDLNLRQGLEGQDLADAMGTTLNNSYVMLSRLRDQVERSLGALLIARMGRDDCDELDELLGDWDGKFSPLLRKRVARHVDICEICSEARKAAVSPLALLAAAPLVPAPAYLKARIISSLRDIAPDGTDTGGGGRGPDVPFNAMGFAGFDDEPERRRRGVLLAAMAAILLLVAGFAMVLNDDDTPLQTAASETSNTLDHDGEPRSGSSTTSTTDASSTTSDDGSTSTTGRVTTTTKAGSAPPVTTRPGVTTTTVRVTTTTRPSDGTGPSVSTPEVFAAECGSQPRSVTLRTSVSDPAGLGSVRMVVGGNSVTRTSGPFTLTAGDFPNGGQIPWTVDARDTAGNQTLRSGTIRLSDCTPDEPTTTAGPPTSGPVGGPVNPD